MPNSLEALAALLVASRPAAGFQGSALPIIRCSVPRTSTTRMGLRVGAKFPESALASWGISGKKAVVFFFGADDAPSCSKELAAFDTTLPDFTAAGVTVVGVRNAAGVKESTDTAFNLVVDEDDEVRNAIGIEKDFFFLGGRETYVLDKEGTVVSVHNNQFDPESHIETALEGIQKLPEDGPLDFLNDIFR